MRVAKMEVSSPVTWIQFFKAAGIPSGIAETYALTFFDNRIQMDMLLDLHKEYLHDMGITVLGDVIAILRHSKKVHEENERKKSMSDIETNNYIPNRSKSPARTTATTSFNASELLPTTGSSNRGHQTSREIPKNLSPASRMLEHYMRKLDESPPRVSDAVPSPDLRVKRKLATAKDSAAPLVKQHVYTTSVPASTKRKPAREMTDDYNAVFLSAKKSSSSFIHDSSVRKKVAQTITKASTDEAYDDDDDDNDSNDSEEPLPTKKLTFVSSRGPPSTKRNMVKTKMTATDDHLPVKNLKYASVKRNVVNTATVDDAHVTPKTSAFANFAQGPSRIRNNVTKTRIMTREDAACRMETGLPFGTVAQGNVVRTKKSSIEDESPVPVKKLTGEKRNLVKTINDTTPLAVKKVTFSSAKRKTKTDSVQAPAMKVRRVLPEHEGGYKITMPSGTTPRTQRILVQQGLLPRKKTVFDRLGEGSVTSTTEVEEPRITITGLGTAFVKNNKQSSVFSRLGDRPQVSSSTPPIGREEEPDNSLPYAGILKSAPKTVIMKKRVATSTMRADLEAQDEGTGPLRKLQLQGRLGTGSTPVKKGKANETAGILAKPTSAQKLSVKSRLGGNEPTFKSLVINTSTLSSGMSEEDNNEDYYGDDYFEDSDLEMGSGVFDRLGY